MASGFRPSRGFFESILRHRLPTAVAALCLAISACAPALQPMGPAVGPAALADDTIVATDGYRLPLRRWSPDGPTEAVIVALHGFNDYSNAFAAAGDRWADRGIATYAYDQRGFGATEQAGVWPGSMTLVADARTVVALVRAEHPGLPVYLLGESMGGAVAIATVTGAAPPPVDGVVLVAPAAWGWDDLTVPERVALWWARTFLPGLTFTGESLNVTPTDNIDVLRDLARDPLVIKGTRVDATAGLVDLMDLALSRADRLAAPTLVLYGDREDVLVPDAVAALVERVPPTRSRVVFYPDGYHMLLRDLAGDIVIDDIGAWLSAPSASLPSGHDRRTDPPPIAADAWRLHQPG